VNISNNLIKNQENLCEEIFKLTNLVKIDTRQNVFNSIPLESKEIEQFRFSFIYNFSQTIIEIDGIPITNEERSNTFLYYSQQPLSDHMKNTRLFKLTETLDTQILKIHEIIDSSRKELIKHENMRDSSHLISNNTQSSLFSTNKKISRDPSEPKAASVSEIQNIRKRGDSTATKIKRNFIENIKEFDEALNEFKKKSKSAFTSLKESFKEPEYSGNNNTKNDEEEKANIINQYKAADQITELPTLSNPQEISSNIQNDEQKIENSKIQDESKDLISVLNLKDNSRIGHKTAWSEHFQSNKNYDDSIIKSQQDAIQEDKSISKISNVFSKLFKEELGALKSDLKDKLEKYRESKNNSMRTMDYSSNFEKEALSEQKTAIYSIQQRCDDNEKKLSRMRSKMHKLIKVFKKTKENEGNQQKEIYQTLHYLKQKINDIEEREKTILENSALSNSLILKQTTNENIQTENNEIKIKKLENLTEKNLQKIFEKYSKGNKAIPLQQINNFSKNLIKELENYKFEKSIPDILIDLTKISAKYGYLNLENLVFCCISQKTRNRAKSVSKTNIKRTKSNNNSIIINHKKYSDIQKYLEKLQEISIQEFETRIKTEKFDTILRKIFENANLKLGKIFEVSNIKREIQAFFIGKIKNGNAKLLFYLGIFFAYKIQIKKEITPK